MRTKDIATKLNIDQIEFERYIRINKLAHTNSIMQGMVIEDHLVKEYVKAFFLDKAEKKRIAEEKVRAAEEEKRLQEIEEMRKKKAMAEMLITSGFNFDGYRIVKYSGYISGDDAISVDRGYAIFGSGVNVKDKLMSSLVTIRRNALRELKEAAYDLGCNAVIGVDFDYLNLDPQTANLSGGTTFQPYVFGVTANGNAVIIEKIEE